MVPLFDIVNDQKQAAGGPGGSPQPFVHFCPPSSAAEQLPCKQQVPGSIPRGGHHAPVDQLAGVTALRPQDVRVRIAPGAPTHGGVDQSAESASSKEATVRVRIPPPLPPCFALRRIFRSRYSRSRMP